MTAYGPVLTSRQLEYVAVTPFSNSWVMVYVLLEESIWPSLVQVTVVAGEPVDVQLRVNIEEDDPSTTCNDETEGGAAIMNKAESSLISSS